LGRRGPGPCRFGVISTYTVATAASLPVSKIRDPNNSPKSAIRNSIDKFSSMTIRRWRLPEFPEGIEATKPQSAIQKQLLLKKYNARGQTAKGTAHAKELRRLAPFGTLI